ncbi:hypothetical protein ACFQ7F_25240 [Streptomyces sp. NPDC056486]|uniref:hypothetical protein n=1 Tax=Streptomyces sp. NPDC056486 TaxID=3345835 RepID=UPI0036918BE9
MTDLLVIGAGKFAVEVAHYIDDITASGTEQYRITRHLAVAGEQTYAPAELCAPLEGYEPSPGDHVVLALSDIARRRAVIDGFMTRHELVAENIIHPSSKVAAGALAGTGIVIGPDNYVGADVTLGSYNVVNYHCTIGHHSRLGENNFLAPNFHCGNSAEIGDDNFFGLSCTVAPDVVIGSDCRFQAGLSLFDNASSGFSYLSPSRIKSIKSL